MMFRNLIFLLALLLSFGQCTQEKAKTKEQTSKTGLKIEYKPTRGQSYTDALGTKHSLRHIPATITNDSTIAIHVQIAFKKEYDYPDFYNNEKFNIFPMPMEWALDGVEITDSMLIALPNFIDNPVFNKTLEPGEKWLLAFGTRYPLPVNYGVFPVTVFSSENRALFHECDQIIDPNKLNIPHLGLELLIGFTSGSQASPDHCISIPAGQISYPES